MSTDPDRRDDVAHHPPGGGVEAEKWILRALLLGVLGAALAALIASVDDIRRYVHIRQM